MTPRPADPTAGPALSVIDLRSQVPAGVLVAGPEPLRLTWRIAPAVAGQPQLGYEIEASRSEGFDALLASSGHVDGDAQVGVPAPGPVLASREVRFHRVRIRTARGWTGWGPVLRTEAGLLRADDWTALAITLPDDPGRDRQSPAPVLRRAFEILGRSPVPGCT